VVPIIGEATRGVEQPVAVNIAQPAFDGAEELDFVIDDRTAIARIEDRQIAVHPVGELETRLNAQEHAEREDVLYPSCNPPVTGPN